MKSKKKRKILPTNSSENSEQWDTFPTFGPKACIPGLGSMNDNWPEPQVVGEKFSKGDAVVFFRRKGMEKHAKQKKQTNK